MAPRNESTFYRAELTGRDLFEYVFGLAVGILLWVVNSMSATSTLVFDPTWTAVGVATGLALFAVSTFWAAGRRFQLALRERRPVFYVAFFLAFLLVVWLTLRLDVAVRPAHYSWFLGLGLSQLLGIALYLRQRSAG
jgi:hypothetical protein